jgi:hypothetical protein
MRAFQKIFQFIHKVILHYKILFLLATRDILAQSDVIKGARGSVDGWGIILQPGRSPVRFPMRSLTFFQRTSSLQPHYAPEVDSASNRKECQDNGRPARKADNLTNICEPIV